MTNRRSIRVICAIRVSFFFLTDFTDSTDFCLLPFVIYHLAQRLRKAFSFCVFRAFCVSLSEPRKALLETCFTQKTQKFTERTPSAA